MAHVKKLGVTQEEVFDGVDVAFNARIRADLYFSGAFVDNPAATDGLTGATFSYCDFDSGMLTQAKLNGSYTLPWQQIQIGGVLQNLPGQQILAQWNITQADVTGR